MAKFLLRHLFPPNFFKIFPLSPDTFLVIRRDKGGQVRAAGLRYSPEMVSEENKITFCLLLLHLKTEIYIDHKVFIDI